MDWGMLVVYAIVFIIVFGGLGLMIDLYIRYLAELFRE